MATREKNERLQELFQAKKNVYSISKLNTIDQCLYQAYRTYKLHDRGKNNVYGIMGGRIHDVLESIIHNELTEKDLIPALNNELADLAMLDIDFPKDFKGGTSIRDGWISDMKHFCNHFVRPNGEFTTEELVIYKVNDDRYVQGYIDLIRHNKDGSLSILDWKTSSQFSKDDLLEHGRQLIFYAMAKEQEGYKVRDVAWIMLKYVEVKFIGKARANSKKETEIVKVLSRRKIVSELRRYLENDLEKLGYGEVDIEIMLQIAEESNTLDNLPKEVQDKYSIKPYVRKYNLTDELREETLNYINSVADVFEGLGDKESDWKGVEITKKNSFFCSVLCSHGDKCPYLQKYFDTLQNTSEEEDLF